MIFFDDRWWFRNDAGWHWCKDRWWQKGHTIHTHENKRWMISLFRFFLGSPWIFGDRSLIWHFCSCRFNLDAVSSQMVWSQHIAQTSIFRFRHATATKATLINRNFKRWIDGKLCRLLTILLTDVKFCKHWIIFILENIPKSFQGSHALKNKWMLLHTALSPFVLGS